MSKTYTISNSILNSTIDDLKKKTYIKKYFISVLSNKLYIELPTYEKLAKKKPNVTSTKIYVIKFSTK